MEKTDQYPRVSAWSASLGLPNKRACLMTRAFTTVAQHNSSARASFDCDASGLRKCGVLIRPLKMQVAKPALKTSRI